VELALDRGYLTGGGRECPLCEVEVELKAGAKELCDRFGLALRAAYGLQPEEKSKFQRALALYKGE
jgi:inorganic triphosphatase YgiF